MTRGRGGVRIPPKIDDVVYEQPLTILSYQVGRVLSWRIFEASQLVLLLLVVSHIFQQL